MSDSSSSHPPSIDSSRSLSDPLLVSSDVSSLEYWTNDSSTSTSRANNRDRSPSASFAIDGSQPRNLYGRSKETEHLQKAFQRVCDDGASEVVRIYGKSGTGKSALVQLLLSGAMAIRNAYCVSGKFDQHLLNRGATSSHFVFMSTVLDLCDLVASNHSTEALDELRSNISQTLSARDCEILSSLLGSSFVNLCHVPPGRPNSGHVVASPTKTLALEENGKQTTVRIKLLYRLLVQMLSSREHPVVFFLDDLQWADDLSLEIIDSFLSDAESRHFLFVCAFRDDEENDNASKRIKSDLVALKETNIELGNMEAVDVNAMLADILQRDEDETRDLGELIHKRTDGNAFFVVQFLDTLRSLGLLDLSGPKVGQAWNIKRIEDETKATDNVGELLVAKLQQLDEETLSTLQIASCIGSKFEIDSLGCVDASLQPNPLQIQTQLDRGARSGLIESIGVDGKMFKFIHDRIQESLYDMIGNESQKQLLHLRIGRYLNRRLSKEGAKDEEVNDDFVFLVTDQLNFGCDRLPSMAERKELSKLNLRAGKAAKSRSAFDLAYRYFEMGLSLLNPEDAWERNHGLCLELSNCLAEMALNIGQFDEIDRLQVLVEEKVRDAQDRFRVCQAQIQAQFADGEGLKAIRTGFRVLSDLGEPMPQAPTNADLVSEFLKMKWMLSWKSDEQLLSLPELRNTRKNLVVELLSYLSLSAFFVDVYAEKGMMALRMMRVTIRWGYTRVTATAFAMYGASLAIMGDVKGQFRFILLAMKLMEKDGHLESKSESLVRLIFCQFFAPFRLSSSQELLTQSELCYKAGMSSGNPLIGYLGWLNSVGFRFACGCNLQELVSEQKTLFRRMEENGMTYLMTLARPFYQELLQIAYPSDCPWRLDGDIMKEDRFVEELVKDEDQFMRQTFFIHKFNLCFLYFKFDEVKDLIQRNSAILLDEAKVRNLGFERLHLKTITAMAFLREYKQTRNRRLLRRVRRSMKAVERFVPRGGRFVLILWSLLKADYAAKVQPHRGKVFLRTLLDDVVNAARESGCVNYEAMANEYVWHTLTDQQEEEDEDEDAELYRYLDRAMASYMEWGALGKVAWLQEMSGRYPHDINGEQHNTTSSSLK